jgi:hypothetical protein
MDLANARTSKAAKGHMRLLGKYICKACEIRVDILFGKARNLLKAVKSFICPSQWVLDLSIVLVIYKGAMLIFSRFLDSTVQPSAFAPPPTNHAFAAGSPLSIQSSHLISAALNLPFPFVTLQSFEQSQRLVGHLIK